MLFLLREDLPFLEGVSCFRFLAIVEAPLRKDRGRCRLLPLAVCAPMAPALLLPHLEGEEPPDKYNFRFVVISRFRGRVPLRGVLYGF